MANLASNLTASSERFPENTALRLDDAQVPYGALDQASARMATLLIAHGLQPGDRVGVMLPNVPSFAIVYYGVLRAGGVVVPMNVLLKELTGAARSIRGLADYLERHPEALLRGKAP